MAQVRVIFVFVLSSMIYNWSVADEQSSNALTGGSGKPVLENWRLPFEKKEVRKFNFDRISSSGDEAYNQVINEAERIAREFQKSKFTGIYRLKLIVSDGQYEMWKQYQRDLVKVFEKNLQRQIEEGADKLEVIIDRAFGGNGESESDVVVETDQRLGKVNNPSVKDSIRLRGGTGGLKLVVDFMDRNLTRDSRSTISYLQGTKSSELRARHNIDLGTQFIGNMSGMSVLHCDARRLRNGSGARANLVRFLPTPKYETRIGCELEWTMK